MARIMWLQLSIICLCSVTQANHLFETIADKSYYSAEAICVQDCLWGAPEYGSDVEDAIGCTRVNCVCSASYEAYTVLSSCVSRNCEYSVSSRQRSATSVYDRYCSSALEAALEVSSEETATTSAYGLATTSEYPLPVQTTPSTPTQTSTSRYSSSTSTTSKAVTTSGGRPTKEEQEALDLQRKNNDIALGCGLGIGLPATLCAIYVVIFRRGHG
ncbi:hypothetical protein V8F06_014318 [Rhypophila decipiens]